MTTTTTTTTTDLSLQAPFHSWLSPQGFLTRISTTSPVIRGVCTRTYKHIVSYLQKPYKNDSISFKHQYTRTGLKFFLTSYTLVKSSFSHIPATTISFKIGNLSFVVKVKLLKATDIACFGWRLDPQISLFVRGHKPHLIQCVLGSHNYYPVPIISTVSQSDISPRWWAHSARLQMHNLQRTECLQTWDPATINENINLIQFGETSHLADISDGIGVASE